MLHRTNTLTNISLFVLCILGITNAQIGRGYCPGCITEEIMASGKLPSYNIIACVVSTLDRGIYMQQPAFLASHLDAQKAFIFNTSMSLTDEDGASLFPIGYAIVPRGDSYCAFTEEEKSLPIASWTLARRLPVSVENWIPDPVVQVPVASGIFACISPVSSRDSAHYIRFLKVSNINDINEVYAGCPQKIKYPSLDVKRTVTQNVVLGAGETATLGYMLKTQTTSKDDQE